MNSPSAIEVKNLDHLGIVAGIIDEIGLVDQINKILGQHPQSKVSAGQAVKAMILNGLGFVSGTLYMFPKYMESYACEQLVGEGVLPEYLNDDRLGRVLDQLYLKGLTGIFTLIALAAVKKYGVDLSSLHLDSSSLHLHGEYKTGLPEVAFEKIATTENETVLLEVAPQPINITYGYSRDHRPDLKQFIIELICSSDGDIPIFLKAASGNQSDTKTFAKTLVYFRENLLAQNQKIKNQLGKLTHHPTLRWIFQCFQGIHLLIINGVSQISNLSNERLSILQFFPNACRRYYLLI
ncbi:IS1634 family transposase [Dendronalium sp. ChiSLP03b]|uniref:IS1634 family transposase n=1 Tax=Dendronalium sp. ChiSLP03b TaxID=3075381 RepID=UPI00391CD6B6